MKPDVDETKSATNSYLMVLQREEYRLKLQQSAAFISMHKCTQTISISIHISIATSISISLHTFIQF